MNPLLIILFFLALDIIFTKGSLTEHIIGLFLIFLLILLALIFGIFELISTWINSFINALVRV